MPCYPGIVSLLQKSQKFPLPLQEGTKGRGNLNGYCSPSPFPSPVKGEGTIGEFLCLFFGQVLTIAILFLRIINGDN